MWSGELGVSERTGNRAQLAFIKIPAFVSFLAFVPSLTTDLSIVLKHTHAHSKSMLVEEQKTPAARLPVLPSSPTPSALVKHHQPIRIGTHHTYL